MHQSECLGCVRLHWVLVVVMCHRASMFLVRAGLVWRERYQASMTTQKLCVEGEEGREAEPGLREWWKRERVRETGRGREGMLVCVCVSEGESDREREDG